MKKLIFAIIMSALFFILLSFVYCNLDDATFGYKVVFKYDILGYFAMKSVPMPMGFVILISFCVGMVTIAVFEALPSLYKTLEIRSKNKRIRQLERELALVRDLHQQQPQVKKDDDEAGEEDVNA